MTIPSNNNDITEDEMAVCLAAVLAYMSTDEQVSAPSENISHWLATARLESLGNTHKYLRLPASAVSNAWRAANLPILSVALLLSLTSFIQPDSAFAQNYGQYGQAQYAAPSATTEQAADLGNDNLQNNEQNTNSGLYDLYRAAALRRKTIAQAPVFPAPTNTFSDPAQVQQSPDQMLFSQPAADSPTLIRVGLILGADKIQVTVPDGAEIFDLQTNNIVAKLAENSRFHALSQPGQTLFVLDQNGAANDQLAHATTSDNQTDPMKQVSYTPLPQTVPPSTFILPNSPTGGSLILSSKEDGIILLNGKAYRGGMRIFPDGKGKLKVINVVNVEDYLLSVVPSEMPSLWSQEALKAQAIAARSYALANAGKHDSDGYDVKANTEDQVYAGCTAESDQTNLAVALTAGLVLKQNNQIIPAYFHSGAGGYTEEPDSFSGTLTPFLRSVPDYDDASPLFSWSQSFTLSKLEDSLRKNGHDTGDLLDIMIVSRTPANRVKQALLIGTNTSQIIGGDELRRVFNLPSTNFNVGPTNDSYIFAGHGFGHGLGLSQWGAKELAEHGYNAAQILKYYYKDVTIERL